ncbi:MAG: hypothetical protein ABSB91_00620 [Sedimentisphaerales bacterium]|jgi:hypothetical protein
MVRLCEDVDILKYEPALFGELHPANQVLATGQNGELAGTTFTAEGADFGLAGVEPGGVIYLCSADSSLDGAYEVAAVDSAEQLCVSILRGDRQDDPIAPPAGPQATGIFYRVSTLKPQIEEVSLRLTGYFGIGAGDTDSEYSAEDILDLEEIRQVCSAGVIATAYAMLAANQGDELLWNKQQHYEQLFNKDKERCRVALDKNGDGVADSVRFGGCGRLIRE